jgi:predicted O-methyltransferase YrrM
MKMQKQWQFSQAVFEYRKLLDTTSEAWAGHTRFAYDLVSNVKPKTIVELGTYKGTSFFAMAQAIKDEGLKTKLIGVDTWEGDIHTGFYQNQIYKDVKKIKSSFYKNVQITLQQMTFDEALKEVKDHSIDVLHIDGLHTYEAVKHDFETWQDKVSETGIILFHDIHYKKRGFGVYKYWAELKKKYSTLEFMHSNGLGIIILDTQLYAALSPLEKFWQTYYPVIAMNDSLSGNFSATEFDTLSAAEKEKLMSEVMVNKMKETEKAYKIELSQLKKERDSFKSQLESVTSSKFFKLWQSYCNMRDSLTSR